MNDELLPGITAWNAGQFCEAADCFEDVWVGEVGPPRQCLRGLIHAALGLHYAIATDVDAAESKLAIAERLLAPFPADFLGVDLDGLRARLAVIRAHLEALRGDRIAPAGLPEGLLPRLSSVRPATRDGSAGLAMR